MIAELHYVEKGGRTLAPETSSGNKTRTEPVIPTTSSILVVESDEGMHHFLRSILERERYSVESARSALEALSMISQSRPGVVVLPTDFLIREGGWALAEHISEVEPGQPILLLKSPGDRRTCECLHGNGPYGLVDRPIRASRLVESIRTLTNGPSHSTSHN